MPIRSVILAVSMASAQPVAVTEQTPPIQVLIEHSTSSPNGPLMLDMLFVNDSDAGVTFTPPRRLIGKISGSGLSHEVTLERVTPAESDEQVEAGSYLRARYLMSVPQVLKRSKVARLTLVNLSSNEFPITATPSGAHPASPAAIALAPDPAVPTEATGERVSTVANRFTGGLSPYEPVYALVGSNAGANAKIQISFKYQIFGEQGVLKNGPSFLDGFHFAFTQRMFWDLSSESAPFRNIDFQPELIYLLAPRRVAPKTSLGLQLGLRHESNGRDGDASRSVNAVYAQPTVTHSIGDYQVVIGPRAWVYFGDQENNENVERFRGYTGLAMQIGAERGMKLSSSARYNVRSGKGALQIDGSYPLDQLLWERLNLYIYGQVFTGYGENLLDYNRHSTAARIGLAITR